MRTITDDRAVAVAGLTQGLVLLTETGSVSHQHFHDETVFMIQILFYLYDEIYFILKNVINCNFKCICLMHVLYLNCPSFETCLSTANNIVTKYFGAPSYIMLHMV